MTAYLAPRFGQRSVNRFVPILSRLCQAQEPTAVSFTPSELGISVETAMARLRDAAHSLSTGLTTHPSINAETLSAVWPLYKVTSDGLDVVVSPRKTEKGTPITPLSVRAADSYALRADAPGFVEALTAFAVLLGQRVLQGQVVISGVIDEDFKDRLSLRYDIAFRRETDNTTIML